MFNITVKIMGKPAQQMNEGGTVQDIMSLLDLEGNYTVNINGKPAAKESLLEEGAYIVLAPSVKGAVARGKVPVKKVKPATKAKRDAVTASKQLGRVTKKATKLKRN